MTRRTKTIIAVTAVGVCAGLAIAVFIHARASHNYEKGFPSHNCIVHLKLIQDAKEQGALEKNKANGADVTWPDLISYMWPMAIPQCPDGGIYRIGKVGEKPTCSIGGKGHTLPDSK